MRFVLFIAAVTVTSLSVAQPIEMALGTASATSPGRVHIHVSVDTAGASAATVVLALHYDDTRLLPVGVLAGEAAAGKTAESLGNGGVFTVVIYGGLGTIENGDLVELAFDVLPGVSPGEIALTGAESSAADPEAEVVAVQISAGAISVTADNPPHTADTDANWAISLAELLRTIQFYNLGGLHCAVGTEDGFAPGPGGQACLPHANDYQPQDWAIGLSEVLRLVQFYNYEDGAYHHDGTGEDGYRPG